MQYGNIVVKTTSVSNINAYNITMFSLENTQVGMLVSLSSSIYVWFICLICTSVYVHSIKFIDSDLPSFGCLVWSSRVLYRRACLSVRLSVCVGCSNRIVSGLGKS